MYVRKFVGNWEEVEEKIKLELKQGVDFHAYKQGDVYVLNFANENTRDNNMPVVKRVIRQFCQ